MSTVLVFGGSGFLGAHVVTALQGDPRVDRLLTPGRRDCDVERADSGQLGDLLRDARPDVVVCCTGRLDGTAEQLVQANTLVTAKLVDALAASAPSARLVRIGSAGEYGRVPEGRPVRESDRPAPVGVYGVSHLAATRIVELAVESGRLGGVSLRVFNPVGTGLGSATVLGQAVVRLLRAVDENATDVRMGPLSAYRDFVDARDVAAAVVAACFCSTAGPTLNIASGRAVQVRDAVRLIADLVGFTGRIQEDGPGAQRSSGVDWVRADIGRAREQLGWSPTHSLEDSLGAIVQASTDRPLVTT
jgi:NDP-hexose 4-ketoreductase